MDVAGVGVKDRAGSGLLIGCSAVIHSKGERVSHCSARGTRGPPLGSDASEASDPVARLLGVGPVSGSDCYFSFHCTTEPALARPRRRHVHPLQEPSRVPPTSQGMNESRVETRADDAVTVVLRCAPTDFARNDRAISSAPGPAWPRARFRRLVTVWFWLGTETSQWRIRRHREGPALTRLR
ncbi:unnamed protein product [Lampetra planeri]